MELTACCQKPFLEDTDICSRCNGHADVMCPDCLGAGTIDVRDDYHPPTAINERWRTVTCPTCKGEGKIERII